MRSRSIAPVLRARLKQFPAVGLLGPRQCGKTTLARSFPGEYFDLEQEADRLRLDLEWDRLCAENKLLILDEAQTHPDIFPRIRGAIDQSRKKNGRFLLLGSVSPLLMTQVSESLAGRLALLELTPFLYSELGKKESLADHWLYGGFPDGGILTAGQFPVWQESYLRLLVERDLPNLGLPAKPAATHRLLSMLAALHGQQWNASQVGQSLGLSYQTVNTYMDFFQGAYLIRQLPAYKANLKKRLIKKPKVYWRDSGLLHALLGTYSRNQLLARPWVGASWEGFVIEQILGQLRAHGDSNQGYFFRTSDGREIDLVLELKGEVWAIEIKLTTAPSTQDMARLNKTADLIEADHRVLLSQVARSSASAHNMSCNLPYFLNHLRRLQKI